MGDFEQDRRVMITRRRDNENRYKEANVGEKQRERKKEKYSIV